MFPHTNHCEVVLLLQRGEALDAALEPTAAGADKQATGTAEAAQASASEAAMDVAPDAAATSTTGSTEESHKATTTPGAAV